jgi:hypothetical protein
MRKNLLGREKCMGTNQGRKGLLLKLLLPSVEENSLRGNMQ